MGKNPIWSFSETAWEQDDERQRFTPVRICGDELKKSQILPFDKLIGAKRHPNADALCACSIFPAEFRNCPYCGLELLIRNQSNDQLWVPPYGFEDGFKLYFESLPAGWQEMLSKTMGQKFPLPAADGKFSFCVAKLGAEKRQLIALQRDSGRFWVFCPEEGYPWVALDGSVGESALPWWSWSMAVDSGESTMYVPSDRGPACITINWASGSISVVRGEGHPIGGAARLGLYVLVPVLKGERFTIVWKRADADIWQECAPASESEATFTTLTCQDLKELCFGIPVLLESKNVLYWSCQEGYVRVEINAESKKLTWKFKYFEANGKRARALVGLGPPYRVSGSRSGIWQLCESHDPTTRDGIIHVIIKLDGDPQLDFQQVDYGQFVSTGNACFSWVEDHWRGIDKCAQKTGVEWYLRLPLIEFSNTPIVLLAKVSEWEGREDFGLNFSDIFMSRQVNAKPHVRFVLESSSVPETPLWVEGSDGMPDGESGSLFTHDLIQAIEITVFIYDGALHIYLPDRNECFQWKALN